MPAPYWRSVCPCGLKAVDRTRIGRRHSTIISCQIDGILVRAINSLDLLSEEGHAMRHCIYSYEDRLQTRTQIAFAIGKNGTTDRSTVLLQYESHSARKWRVTIVEHRAPFNAVPSPVCHAVARGLCQELSSERYADALNLANVARVRRCESLQFRRSSVQGVIRGVRDLPRIKKLIDRSLVREPLLMLIAG